MRKQITDDFGTYETKTWNRIPVEDAQTIYLNIFDNVENGDNVCRYKLVFTVVMDDDYQDYHCPILNHFEPARWLRSIPDGIKDEPFYRDFHRAINRAKKKDISYEKLPSAGFFKLPRKKGMKAGSRNNIPNAIAMMVIEKGEDPVVAIRFVDFTWSGTVSKNDSNKGPAYSVCIKSGSSDFSSNLDFSEYF